MMTSVISIKSVAKGGWGLYKHHFFKLLPFSIFVAGLELLFQLHIAGMILYQLLFDAVLNAGFFYYFLAQEKGQAGAFHFSDFFRGFKRIFDLLVLAILLNVRVFFGFILLIIPAFYLMNVFSQSIFLLLEEKGDPFEVLKMSRDLVKPQFWRVLNTNGLILTLSLPEMFSGPDTAAASPFFFAWSVLVSPLAAACAFCLYRQIMPRNAHT